MASLRTESHLSQSFGTRSAGYPPKKFCGEIRRSNSFFRSLRIHPRLRAETHFGVQARLRAVTPLRRAGTGKPVVFCEGG